MFCKEGGAPLASQAWIRRDITLRPTVAAALSLVPGLGHLYRGHPWKAIAWFLGVAMAYPLAYPLGFVLHLVCAGNAALSGAIQENTVIRGPRGHGTRAGRLRHEKAASHRAEPPLHRDLEVKVLPPDRGGV